MTIKRGPDGYYRDEQGKVVSLFELKNRAPVEYDSFLGAWTPGDPAFLQSQRPLLIAEPAEQDSTEVTGADQEATYV